jgi:hypothetical protein
MSADDEHLAARPVVLLNIDGTALERRMVAQTARHRNIAQD